MKAATWNVNSIRIRLERVLAWLERKDPDVLCLQETKVVDEDFPREPFEARGYHVETYGQKTYNGVALISRDVPEDLVRGLPDDPADADRRLIAATFDGVRVVCVYVPNGKAIESESFTYKLEWLERLQGFLDGDAAAQPTGDVLLVGDFNIAPEARDVFDPERMRGQLHFHPQEHAALGELAAWGLADLFRHHHEDAGRYSWWDYRQLAFPKNRGLRIDLMLASAPLVEASTACDMDRDERKGKKPSDHVPVWATFDR